MKSTASFLTVLPFFIRLKMREIFIFPWRIVVSSVAFLKQEWKYLINALISMVIVLAGATVLVISAGFISRGLWTYVSEAVMHRILINFIDNGDGISGAVAAMGVINLTLVAGFVFFYKLTVEPWIKDNWKRATELSLKVRDDENA